MRPQFAPASFHAGKTGEALIEGFGIEKRLNIAVFNHINELVGMIFHLAVCRAGTAAFSATHTLAGVDTADAYDFVFEKIIFL